MQDNFILYSGKVRTRKYRRGALVRENRLTNNGTTNLFSLMCEGLYSNIEDSRRPHNIDVCYRSGNAFMSMLTSPVTIGNTFLTSNPSTVGLSTTPVSVTFSTTISSGQVSPTSSGVGSGNVYYVLRTSNDTSTTANILAFLEDTNTSANSFGIATDEVFILDWTLTVGNQGTTQSQG